jgi:ATP-dependent Clp protease ATP-binding subunit ClpA
MTSNLGFNQIDAGLGFNKSFVNKEEIDKIIARFFKKELLNRVDEVFVFNKLGIEDYKVIAKNYLEELASDFDLREILLDLNYDCNGVRELKKEVRKKVNKIMLKLDNNEAKVR